MSTTAVSRDFMLYPEPQTQKILQNWLKHSLVLIDILSKFGRSRSCQSLTPECDISGTLRESIIWQKCPIGPKNEAIQSGCLFYSSSVLLNIYVILAIMSLRLLLCDQALIPITTCVPWVGTDMVVNCNLTGWRSIFVMLLLSLGFSRRYGWCSSKMNNLLLLKFSC